VRRLPPGSHGIPADVVARNQRERLVAAMAEECAEAGYAEATVAAVAKRAGVSSLTFYRQFEGKRECMLAAHGLLSERLLEATGGDADEGDDPAAKARAALRALLAVFAADPPSARLLTIEILAAGPEGVARHDAMVAAVAERLGCGWVPAAGLLALAGKLAVAGEAERLPSLEDELADTLSSQNPR
jgi:AcrR family transcriptional regulator